MGLDVRVLRAEELARALPRKLLRRVYGKAAGVPALARIALGVLVHEDRTRRLAASAGRRVLGRDQVDLGVLLPRLRLDRGKHLGVVAHKPRAVGKTLRALELPAAARVALALVDRSRDERLRDFDGVGGRDDVCTEAEDVRPVVLAGDRRRVGRRADGGTDVLEAVCGHRHSDAGAAHKYAEVGFAGGHGLGDLRRIVRIVAACLVGRTHVDDLRGARKGVDESGLQFYAAMVGTNRNVHLVFLGVVACTAKVR